MGNRGTTPSWDEEMIGRYGFDMYLRMFRRPRTRPRSEIEQENRQHGLQDLITVLRQEIQKRESPF
jgi:hypothetical protein